MQFASKETDTKENTDVTEKYQNFFVTDDELAEHDSKVLLPLIEKFSKAYDKKPEAMTNKEWLKDMLKQELPEKQDSEIEKDAEEIISAIEKQDKFYKEVNSYCSNGGTKEKWLSNKISGACTGIEVLNFSEYLSGIDNAIENANKEMLVAIMTKNGNISQNPNLHGFIAEQYHANTFNINAALQNSPLRAEVLKPNGHGYAKDSVDLLIKDTRNGKVIERIQVKYGKDYKATVNMLTKGNYRSQRALVPSGQRNAVAEKIPTKSVSDRLGGDNKTGSISSDPLSKKDALKMEERAQNKGKIVKHTLKSYKTDKLLKNIGEQAAMSGVWAAGLTAGIDSTIKLVRGEKIDPAETMKLAIYTGADVAAKTAVSGAIKVGVAKGALKMLPRGIPNIGIAALGCIAIENAKVLYKVSKGEMTVIQGVDAMGRVTCSTIGGVVGSIEGGAAAVGLGLLVCTNPIALGLAGIAGLIAGGMAGSAVAEGIYNGAKAVAKGAVSMAKSAVKKAWSVGKSIASRAWSTVKSIFS